MAVKAGVGLQNTDCDTSAIIAEIQLPQIVSLCTASANDVVRIRERKTSVETMAIYQTRSPMKISMLVLKA